MPRCYRHVAVLLGVLRWTVLCHGALIFQPQLHLEMEDSVAEAVICPQGHYVCPDNNTCCRVGGDRWACCPLPDAVCCADHIHCCPEGTVCNLPQHSCDQGSALAPVAAAKVSLKGGQGAGFELQKEGSAGVLQWEMTGSTVLLNAFVICADASTFCRDGWTCCRLPSGSYNCCRLPGASCCSDGVHCCPQGTTCDLARNLCHGPAGSRPPLPSLPACPPSNSSCLWQQNHLSLTSSNLSSFP